MWCLGRSPAKDGQKVAPFPYKQMFVIALCRICEPIAFMSIFPYVYYMIESFHITSDDRAIALYAGMVTSAFAFAEFTSSIAWGWLSDRFGRKPILLCGMAGTGISMLAFGFSRNLAAALTARALGGLLNGNIGVLQSVVSEIITEESHKGLGFAIMPVVWCLGSIIGSALGGVLADPVRNYGWSRDSIFATYPYLLPNLVCTAVVIVGLIIGLFFMEETHPDLKQRKDRGLETGRRLLNFLKDAASFERSVNRKRDFMEETLTLVPHDEDILPDYRSAAPSPQLLPVRGVPPPAYQSVEGTPRSSVSNESAHLLRHDGELDIEAASIGSDTPKPKLLTPQVFLNVVSYGILAYHTISAEQLLSVLLSLPTFDKDTHLPFYFTGGFGLSTKSIGGILSVQGVIQVFVTLLLWPWLNHRLGPLTIYRITLFTYPFLYMVVPYLTLLPDNIRMPCVYMVLVWKVTAQAFTFPPIQIMMATLATTPRVLGTLNGFNASSASFSRALGPTLSGLIQSAGLANGIVGLPWWANACVSFCGFALSLVMVYVPQERKTISEKPASPSAGLPSEAEGCHSALLATAELPTAALDTTQASSSTDTVTQRQKPIAKN